MSGGSFLPVNDNSNRDQNAPPLSQCGSDNLLPRPFHKIKLRDHLACDVTTNAEDIHGLTSLTSPYQPLARHLFRQLRAHMGKKRLYLGT
jgi:hypothetical protein